MASYLGRRANRIRIIGIAALVGLVGCTPIEPEAMQVRQISLDAANACRFIGPVSGAQGMGLSTAMDAESALNQVRNAVARFGGNAFVINQASTTLDSSSVQADAYVCG